MSKSRVFGLLDAETRLSTAAYPNSPKTFRKGVLWCRVMLIVSTDQGQNQATCGNYRLNKCMQV